MNKALSKNDLVDAVKEKLSSERIVIGGNKILYKRKYHLRYTDRIVSNVMNAFYEVLTDTIKHGDSIKVYDYFKIEPKYYRERVVKDNTRNRTYIVPPRYKVWFKMGKKLEDACAKLLKKNPNGYAE